MALISTNGESKQYPITYPFHLIASIICSCQLPSFKSEICLESTKHEITVHDIVEDRKLKKSKELFDAAIRGHIDIGGDGTVSRHISPKYAIDSCTEWELI